MNRKKILLLFGGESSEHEVSISSARNVYAAIDSEKYSTWLGYIDRHGKWWLLERWSDEPQPDGVQLVAALGMRGFMTVPGNQVISPDVILPILHGKNGEDGSVQALAQLMHLPIVGCDMTASVLAMDKIAQKRICRDAGLPVVDFVVHDAGTAMPTFSDLRAKLGDSMFVKPSRSGSSVGISKVTAEAELEPAIKLAHEHDEHVAIEAGITGRELEIAVLGTPPHHKASAAGEIQPDEEFYSYDSKYSTDSQTKVLIPAPLDEATSRQMEELALEAYATLGCQGLARVDFFLDESGKLYLNELNTLPGFTNISMYPKLWHHAGMKYPELIDRLIDDATRRQMV